MSQPKVSVIVPAFNAQSSIERCVTGILAQTYANFELIIVDDGSTDSTGAICDSLAKEDSRIRVIHKQNGGVSSARNAGLDAAQGEYIVFADADDEVKEGYLEGLVDAKGKADLVVQGFEIRYHNGKTEKQELHPIFIESACFDKLFTNFGIHFSGHPFGKLYSNRLIAEHGIRFDENLQYAEDLVFLLRFLCYAESVKLIPGSNYIYNFDYNSTESKQFKFPQSQFLLFKSCHELISYLSEKNGFNAPVNFLNDIALFLLNSIYGMYMHDNPRCKRIKYINDIKEEYSNYIKIYYNPGPALLRLFKGLLLTSTGLFDYFANIKFSDKDKPQ